VRRCHSDAILQGVSERDDLLEMWRRVESDLRLSLGLLREMLGAEDVHQITEYLDHNELGLALDHLVDALLASGASALPDRAFDLMSDARAEMKMMPVSWDAFARRFG
jgi:hypothetical protein